MTENEIRAEIAKIFGESFGNKKNKVTAAKIKAQVVLLLLKFNYQSDYIDLEVSCDPKTHGMLSVKPNNIATAIALLGIGTQFDVLHSIGKDKYETIYGTFTQTRDGVVFSPRIPDQKIELDFSI